jgi:uncharacterized protein (DUF1800 family)
MIPDQNVVGPLTTSMDPYGGAWTKQEAAHLLRRASFGPTFQQIQTAVAAGMDATVNALLQIPTTSMPLSYDPNETISASGSTWVNSVYPADATSAQAHETARVKSLGAWLMKRLNTENTTIAEKMCLFWQNHFAATLAPDARASYKYHLLIRNHALGNFKQFVKDMTIDPTMLLFLNGATNTLYSPNENYAREILELFTIGKGPQIGIGDYTTFKEEDVAAGAKVFTGYIVEGLRSTAMTTPVSTYYDVLHDQSTKQFSVHFGNQTIAANGATEYADYIDLIFQQEQVAHFISTKLYRYFVNYDLTTEVQTNVIPVMAQTLLDNNYEILPVLQQLFKSQHFYDVAYRGAIIRNPLEVVFGMLNPCQSVPNFSLATNSDMYIALYYYAQTMGQAYGTPPSVAGWIAYYQAPAFSKLWVNSTTIKSRFDLANFITLFTGVPVNGSNFKVNALALVNGLSEPNNAVAVIDDLCTVFFPKALSVAQKTLLKFILTGGLPDFEWTVDYEAYAADPTNASVSNPIKSKVEQVLSRIFQMPEFQTI